MNHDDHVRLIKNGVQGNVWADFGSGSGAFTLALAEVMGAGGEIYSVDQDGGSLREQQRSMQARFPKTVVHYMQADFSQKLELPPLDGILMANSLHYQRHKEGGLALVRGYLKPGGRLIVVEYNVDHGNMWVPYPLSYSTWEKLAGQNGFTDTRLLATHPSRFLTEFFAAVSVKKSAED